MTGLECWMATLVLGGSVTLWKEGSYLLQGIRKLSRSVRCMPNIPDFHCQSVLLTPNILDLLC